MIIIPTENESYKDYIQRILQNRENKKDKNNYQEKHHIIPKSWGGNNEINNLIFLYPEEHYQAHKLLALENPNNISMQYAWLMMSRSNKQSNSFATPEEYAAARQQFVATISGPNNINYQTTRVNGEKNPMYGKHCSDHCKALLRAKLSGVNNPAAHKVRCIESGLIFGTAKSAAEYYHISRSDIAAQIGGRQKSAGKDPVTGEKLHWEYIE